MTHDVFNAPLLLGGKKNGQHRTTNQAPHSNPNQTPSPGSWTLAARYASAFTLSAITSAEYPVEDAGIRAGEIIGYRCWIVTDYFLYSMAIHNFRWKPKGVERCEDKLTGVTFGPGLHAFKEESTVQEQYAATAPSCPLAFGSVFMWGDVIEHEHGYRAEYAAVRSIDSVIDGGLACSAVDCRRRLDSLRQTYGVTP